MTKWMLDCNVTQPKSVGLLAMTDLDSYFHCYLVLMGRMRIFLEIKELVKVDKQKGKRHTPLIPLNGE